MLLFGRPEAPATQETQANDQLIDVDQSEDNQEEQIIRHEIRGPDGRFVRADGVVASEAPRHNVRGPDGRFVPRTQPRAMIAFVEPKTYIEAVSGDQSAQWIDAMYDEVSSLFKNQVFVEAVCPESKNVISSKWVFKIKTKPNGEVDKFKARFCARGFSQVQGIDYEETYAPVAHASIVRMLLAHAAVKNMYIMQFDIKTAFLYGLLDEEIYVKPPEGFKAEDNRVWRLKRSLNGLKQSPSCWNQTFSAFLREINLQTSEYDHCVFLKKGSSFLAITIYVDDGLIFGENYDDIVANLKQLKARFDMTIMNATSYLGIEIASLEKGILIHQEGHVLKLLDRFGMSNCSIVDNPLTIYKSEPDVTPLGLDVPYKRKISAKFFLSKEKLASLKTLSTLSNLKLGRNLSSSQ